jgi:hypothetical protein
MSRLVISGASGNRVYYPLGFESQLVIAGGDSQTILQGENVEKLKKDIPTYRLIRENHKIIELEDSEHYVDIVETPTEKPEEDDDETPKNDYRPKRRK